MEKKNRERYNYTEKCIQSRGCSTSWFVLFFFLVASFFCFTVGVFLLLTRPTTDIGFVGFIIKVVGGCDKAKDRLPGLLVRRSVAVVAADCFIIWHHTDLVPLWNFLNIIIISWWGFFFRPRAVFYIIFVWAVPVLSHSTVTKSQLLWNRNGTHTQFVRRWWRQLYRTATAGYKAKTEFIIII